MKTKESLTIKGSPIVNATVLRIPLSERSADLHYYDVRHDDECLGIPVTLENTVIANHFGTVILKEHLQLNQPYELSEEETLMIMSLL